MIEKPEKIDNSGLLLPPQYFLDDRDYSIDRDRKLPHREQEQTDKIKLNKSPK